MSLGERIKGRRKALNITQDQLAALTGITQAQISRYELDLSDPTSTSLLSLAEALQVTTDWLVGREDYPADMPHQYGELNKIEQEALRILRSKSPERQQAMIEIMRIAK